MYIVLFKNEIVINRLITIATLMNSEYEVNSIKQTINNYYPNSEFIQVLEGHEYLLRILNNSITPPEILFRIPESRRVDETIFINIR